MEHKVWIKHGQEQYFRFKTEGNRLIEPQSYKGKHDDPQMVKVEIMDGGPAPGRVLVVNNQFGRTLRFRVLERLQNKPEFAKLGKHEIKLGPASSGAISGPNRRRSVKQYCISSRYPTSISTRKRSEPRRTQGGSIRGHAYSNDDVLTCTRLCDSPSFRGRPYRRQRNLMDRAVAEGHLKNGCVSAAELAPVASSSPAIPFGGILRIRATRPAMNIAIRAGIGRFVIIGSEAIKIIRGVHLLLAEQISLAGSVANMLHFKTFPPEKIPFEPFKELLNRPSQLAASAWLEGPAGVPVPGIEPGSLRTVPPFRRSPRGRPPSRDRCNSAHENEADSRPWRRSVRESCRTVQHLERRLNQFRARRFFCGGHRRCALAEIMQVRFFEIGQDVVNPPAWLLAAKAAIGITNPGIAQPPAGNAFCEL